MRKDIPEYQVEGIALSIVKEKNEEDQTIWNVYLINLKPHPIEGVLVTSKGYGELNGESVKTSTLRHFLDTVPGKSYSLIEPIMENVFGLNNEYWISFFENKILYDKKYIFLAESVTEHNLIQVPIINKEGVVIK
jgi:hypothetical protein